MLLKLFQRPPAAQAGLCAIIAHSIFDTDVVYAQKAPQADPGSGLHVLPALLKRTQQPPVTRRPMGMQTIQNSEET